MNKFSENPLFLFVDDLADGSSKFASDGKIVELFDTGCDARTPGAALKISQKRDATIQRSGSVQNNIPNVRKPPRLSLSRDKSSVKKNTSLAGHGDKKRNIPGACESSESSKLMTWNSNAKDKVPTKDNEVELKAGLNSVVGTQNDAKGPEHSKQVGVSSEQTTIKLNSIVRTQNDAKDSEQSKQVGVVSEQKTAKPNSTRTWRSPTYSGKYLAAKSQSISSSVPKQYKVPEARSSNGSALAGRAKISPTKSVTNRAKSTPIKPSKVTSEASLNHGMKKYVNRAVDKDSLSNCSRQLQMAKASGALPFTKTAYTSRLPRSGGAAKLIPEGKPKLEPTTLIGTEKKATVKTALMKIVGGTDHELHNRDLQSKVVRTIPTVRSGKREDHLKEGETVSKTTLDVGSMPISQREHGDDVKVTLSTKTGDLTRNTMTLSSSRSKMTVSKMPLPRFGRNPVISNKTLKKPANLDKVSKVNLVPDSQTSKSIEKLSTKVIQTNTAQCPDSEKKVLANVRPVTYTEKRSARPSAKCHNSIPRESEAKNTTMTLRTKLSKPRTPSIVPKLMHEFRLQEKKRNEVSRCSSTSLQTVRSASLKVKIENDKLKTEMKGKPPRTSGILSDQLNERLGRLSDQVQDISSSKVPLPSRVTRTTGIANQRDDRVEQGKSKINVVCASGIRAVEKNDEEIELKNISEDGSAMANRKLSLQSSTCIFGASKTQESELRHSAPSCPSGAGSKVPHLVVTKRIPKKEIVRNTSAGSYPKKPALSIPRRASKISVKTHAKTEAKPLTPPTKKSVERIPESETVQKTSVITNSKENKDEDVIPIMNPALYNVGSFATQYRKRGNLENTVPQDSVDRRKLESWIDGHEQAYLKGRAIGLKVADMARAAKEDLKREFIRSGLRGTTPMSLSDKSQEIVDIGVSVIERVLAEKENKIRNSSSVQGDQALDYYDFDKNIKWNGGQWFM